MAKRHYSDSSPPPHPFVLTAGAGVPVLMGRELPFSALAAVTACGAIAFSVPRHSAIRA
jgi:hypothetical protein